MKIFFLASPSLRCVPRIQAHDRELPPAALPAERAPEPLPAGVVARLAPDVVRSARAGCTRSPHRSDVTRVSDEDLLERVAVRPTRPGCLPAPRPRSDVGQSTCGVPIPASSPMGMLGLKTADASPTAHARTRIVLRIRSSSDVIREAVGCEIHFDRPFGDAAQTYRGQRLCERPHDHVHHTASVLPEVSRRRGLRTCYCTRIQHKQTACL